MKISRKLKTILIYIVPTILIFIFVPLFEKVTSVATRPFGNGIIRIVISPEVGEEGKMQYSIGYNYEMLQKFSSELSCEPEIILSAKRSYIDSLLLDSIDIYVVPKNDTILKSEGFTASIALADSSRWVMRKKDRNGSKTVNRWISHYSLTKDHKEMTERFSPSFEPYRRLSSGKKYSILSPYDHILSKYSKAIGWDRYALTALVWQESKFHIDAKSARGAEGLMQMMPRTASRFSYNDDMLNPESNMKAATDYIARLQRIFIGYAADDEELLKMTLGAYNAGEGRILECIRFASASGEPHSRWEDIVKIIPTMRNDSTLLAADSLGRGIFQGYETINYVKSTMALRRAFESISSGRSAQDQPAKRTDKE